MPSYATMLLHAPRKKRLVLVCCAVVAAIVCMLSIAPLVHMLSKPDYPLAADHRRQSFLMILDYIDAYSRSNRSLAEIEDREGEWSWRVMVAAENCSAPPNELHATLEKSWRDAANSRLDRCGDLAFRRADGSAFVLSIKGDDSVYEHGIENFHSLPGSLIILMETADRSISWMEPRDFVASDLSSGRGPNPGSEYGRGFHVAFADGSVWYLHNQTPVSMVERFLTAKEAAEADRDALLGEYVLMKTSPRW